MIVSKVQVLKKTPFLLFSILLVLVLSLNSCKKESTDITTAVSDVLNLPSTPFNYENITLPAHLLTNGFPGGFPGQHAAIIQDNTPADNPITNEGATLGRVLFYDKKLSANGTVACASCHIQANGFSDPKILSLGFDGGNTRRHSMSLANARFYESGKFFWDERAESLEEQVLMPIQDAVEMGMTLDELVAVVSAQDYYVELFTNAFGSSEVTTDRISKALSQFVRSIVSTNSKYDVGRAMVNNPLADFPNFTAQENQGKNLFFTAPGNGLIACGGCHATEAFISKRLPGGPNPTQATNNGLDPVSTTDLGVFEATGVTAHTGRFKVPSLKNIAVTAPYMHDGRFANLNQVIGHYSNGIEDHPQLDPGLRNNGGNPGRYGFNQNERAALVAFLNTLTDTDMLTDEKYSDPFK